MSRCEKSFRAVFMMVILVVLMSGTVLAGTSKPNVMFIFDASGSMDTPLGSKSKIAIAKDALGSIVKDLPAESKAGLVVYGQNRQGDCNDVEELVALSPLDKKAFIQKLDSVKAKGMTAISFSIQKAAEKMKGLTEESMIVVISDGQENCKKDPCQTVSDLKKQGIKFILYSIGFDIKEDEGSQLSCMAKAGGGTYFPAKDGDELKQVLRKIFGMPEPVRAESGKPSAAPEKPQKEEVHEQMIIAASVGRIRKTPSLNAEVVMSLKKGDKVSVIENKGEWHNVRAQDGKTGWGHWSIFEATEKKTEKKPIKDSPKSKELKTPKEISEIRATVMPDGEEKIVFVMNEAVSPKINILKEAVPKVICDFSGVSVSKNIGSSIKVNGHLLTGIRIGKQTAGSSNIRVVLDTVFNRPYTVKQDLSKEEFTIILIPEKRSK